MRSHWKNTLRLIRSKPIAVAHGGATEWIADQVFVNWQTAEALKRRGLITITREIDGDGYKAWDLALTAKGREELGDA